MPKDQVRLSDGRARKSGAHGVGPDGTRALVRVATLPPAWGDVQVQGGEDGTPSEQQMQADELAIRRHGPWDSRGRRPPKTYAWAFPPPKPSIDMKG